MSQIKLTIEYDGTAYVGWQLQPNGVSIQGLLEEAIAGILHEPVRLHSSGRTDAGVHAKGMIACLKTEKSLPMSAYVDGVNCRLPPDIAVVSAEQVSDGFHPRYDAKGKHYRYTISISSVRSPLSRLYAWHLDEPPDLWLMQQAAACFVGEHDFASFRTSGCVAKTTSRRIDAVNVTSVGDQIIVDVIGSGFMRNMVRLMVGTLVDIGRGRKSPDHVMQCLESPGAAAGLNAPPWGLCLMQVYY